MKLRTQPREHAVSGRVLARAYRAAGMLLGLAFAAMVGLSLRSNVR